MACQNTFLLSLVLFLHPHNLTCIYVHIHGRRWNCSPHLLALQKYTHPCIHAPYITPHLDCSVLIPTSFTAYILPYSFPSAPLLPLLEAHHPASGSYMQIHCYISRPVHVTNISINNCLSHPVFLLPQHSLPICIILRPCSQARQHRHPGSNSSIIVLALALGGLGRSTTAATSLHDEYLGPDSVLRV